MSQLAKISSSGVTITNTGTVYLNVLDSNGTQIGSLDLADSKTYNLQPSTSASPFTITAGGITIATLVYNDNNSFAVKAGETNGKARFSLTVPMDA